jgi:hypothetical protein
VVESALAEALRLAAQAQQWDIVAELARELAARRQARGGDGLSSSAASCAGQAKPDR